MNGFYLMCPLLTWKSSKEGRGNTGRWHKSSGRLEGQAHCQILEEFRGELVGHYEQQFREILRPVQNSVYENKYIARILKLDFKNNTTNGLIAHLAMVAGAWQEQRPAQGILNQTFRNQISVPKSLQFLNNIEQNKKKIKINNLFYI